MSVFESCVERATALAATCGWLALGGGTEAAVGLVIGGAGLAAVVSGAVRRHGPESEAALKKIRARIAADLERYAKAERWDARDDIAAADAAMERALAGCFMDRQALAASARSPEGFPGAATRLILASLAEREPATFGADGSRVARDYAQRVIRTALEAAIENEDYFKALQPHLLMETLRGLGTLDEKVDAMHADIRKILDMVESNSSLMSLAAQMDGIRFEIAANPEGQVFILHNEPFPHDLVRIDFDPARREMFFVLPGNFRRDLGCRLHPDLVKNLAGHEGRCLMVHVDPATLQAISGEFFPIRTIEPD